MSTGLPLRLFVTHYECWTLPDAVCSTNSLECLHHAPLHHVARTWLVSVYYLVVCGPGIMRSSIFLRDARQSCRQTKAGRSAGNHRRHTYRRETPAHQRRPTAPLKPHSAVLYFVLSYSVSTIATHSTFPVLDLHHMAESITQEHSRHRHCSIISTFTRCQTREQATVQQTQAALPRHRSDIFDQGLHDAFCYKETR